MTGWLVILTVLLAFTVGLSCAVVGGAGYRYRARWLEAQLDGFIARETADPTLPWPPAGTHLDADGGVVWDAPAHPGPAPQPPGDHTMTEPLPERITIDGQPVDPDLLGHTYIAEVNGELHLIEGGQVVEGGVRPVAGGMWRDAIGRLYRFDSSMAMLTTDQGDDVVGAGVEPHEPNMPLEVHHVEGT